MVRERKSKDNDLEKLRLILDNPSDPKIKEIAAKHENSLESIRERLSEESSNDVMKHSISTDNKGYDRLEPTAVVHEKEEKVVESEIEQTNTEQSQKETEKTDDTLENYNNEELFEVEHLEISESKDTDDSPSKTEFVEVKTKDIEEIFEKSSQLDQQASTPESQTEKQQTNAVHKEEELPEWEPIGQEGVDESDTNVQKQKVSKSSENKPIDQKKDDLLVSTPKESDNDKEFVAFEPVEEEKTIQNEQKQDIKQDTEFIEIEQIDKKQDDLPVQLPKENEQAKEKKSPEWEPVEEKTESKEDLSMWEPIESESVTEETSTKATDFKAEDQNVETKTVQKDKQVITGPITRDELKKSEQNLKKKKKEEQKLRKLEQKNAKREAKQQKKEQKKLEKQRQKEIKKQKTPALQKNTKQITEQDAQRKQEEILENLRFDKSKTTPDAEVSFEKDALADSPGEWDSYELDESSEIKQHKSGYTHGEFTLYEKEIHTAKGKKRTVHFFSKTIPDEGEPIPLPNGYYVKVNKRTGLPYLKKKI